MVGGRFIEETFPDGVVENSEIHGVQHEFLNCAASRAMHRD